MFTKSARYYDAIYSWKDYEGEVERLRELIHERCDDAASLLDVACGTGKHLDLLKRDYQVEGLELDPEMARIARRRLPGVQIHEGDMTSFDIGKTFDVVLCLFSSIGYVSDVGGLNDAVAHMVNHLRSPGVIIVEPWLTPEFWDTDNLHAVFVDEPDIKIARVSDNSLADRTSVLNFHYLVGTKGNPVAYFREQHRLMLFTHEEYTDAFRRAGMNVEHDPEGLMGRGLYVASK